MAIPMLLDLDPMSPTAHMTDHAVSSGPDASILAAAGSLASTLRLGYLGRRIDHCDNAIRLFESIGIRLHVLPDSSTWGVYNSPPAPVAWRPASTLWRGMARLADQIGGTRHTGYADDLVALIDREDLACLIAYWGTGIVGDIIAIKRRRPRVKVILNLLCHPTGLSHAKVAAQNWHLRRSARWLDGIIVSSHAMQAYLQEHVLRGNSVPILIWPPYYSRQLFPVQRHEACPTAPNLLFLGRMDWQRAQPSDNIGVFLDQLLENGVHVYHHHSPAHAPGSVPPHACRHTFPYLSLAEAATYATQFDASLMLYNLRACRRTDRFDVTVPDRLVASVAAGVPVALPAQGYAACREYLKDYGAVIPFASAAELAQRLRDRASVAELRRLARHDSRKYVGERHLNSLLAFIHAITSPAHASFTCEGNTGVTR